MARRGGFTFIEILATLLFISIVLPSVMGGISLCLSTAGFARQQAQAASLCQGKMMELLAAGAIQNGELSGDFGDQRPDYRWKAQVRDWDGAGLWQLDVTVSWQHVHKMHDLTLSTLTYMGASQ